MDSKYLWALIEWWGSNILMSSVGVAIWVGIVRLSCKVAKKEFKLRLRNPSSWAFIFVAVAIFVLIFTSCQCVYPSRDPDFGISKKLQKIDPKDLKMLEEPKFIDGK
ncbi:MAG: hypothetical protein JNM12_01660 [Alphaproteobacteria bacterium]|nr:hypothetical protein [Alphaproteobacteria bacterium]